MNILAFVEVKFVLNKTQALYKILYLNGFLLVVFCIQSKMCGNISEPRFCAWCGFVPRIFWWEIYLRDNKSIFGEIKRGRRINITRAK